MCCCLFCASVSASASVSLCPLFCLCLCVCVCACLCLCLRPYLCESLKKAVLSEQSPLAIGCPRLSLALVVLNLCKFCVLLSFLCLCFCLCVCQSLSIILSLSLCLCLCLSFSLALSLCPCLCLSLSLSPPLSLCLFLCLGWGFDPAYFTPPPPSPSPLSIVGFTEYTFLQCTLSLYIELYSLILIKCRLNKGICEIVSISMCTISIFLTNISLDTPH